MIARTTIAGFGAVLLLLSAACGDDDSSSDAVDQPVTSVDGAADESENGRPDTFEEDLPVAEAAVLTLDDLPVGWSSKPRDDEEEDDDEYDQELADCMDMPVEEFADSGNPKAESETFVAEDDSEVEAEVVIAPTVDEATEDFERATSPEFLDCMREVLPALMEQAAEDEGGEFTIADASIGPLRIEDSGDRSAAFRLTISVEVDAFSVDFYSDILVAQVGRSTAQLSTLSLFSPRDVEFSQSLLDVMVDRIDVDAVS